MGAFFEEGTGRFRALWRLVFQYWTYRLAVPLCASLLVTAWLSLRSGPGRSSGGSGLSALAGSPALPLLSAVASLVGTLLSVWLAARFLDRRPFRGLGFRLDRGWWLDFSFGMALGALLMTAVFLAELGLGWLSVTGAFETVGTEAPFALAALIPIAVFVCVGFSEEIASRGYQLTNVAEGLNYPAVGPRAAVLLAWVASSVFFGLLHAGNPNATTLSTLNITVAGLMLGFGYVLSGQLAIPIGLHITWNLFQNAVYGLPVSGFASFGASLLSTKQGGPEVWTGGSFGPEGGLIGPAAMILAVLLIALWVRLRTGKLSLHLPIAEGRGPGTSDPRRGAPYTPLSGSR